MTATTDFRASLFDDLLWRILTSDEEGRDAADRWLRNEDAASREVHKARKALADAQRKTLPRHTRSWHQAQAEFVEWEGRHRVYQNRILARLRDLRLNEQDPLVAGGAALERARRHASWCETQMKHAVASLADLASLVEAHIAGRASMDELDQALDDLTVRKNSDQFESLRALLAAKRATYANTGEVTGS